MIKFVIFSSLLAAALALPQYRGGSGVDPKLAQILKFSSDILPEGSYQFSFETDNGIQAQESAQIQPVSQDEAKKNVQGGFSWVSPEGEQVAFSYIADENGYQPTGSHLPTPPPIPEAILKSLEYNRAHPEEDGPQQQVRIAPQQPFRRF